MMLHIPDVLTRQQVTAIRTAIDAADWVDGRATAGSQGARVKRNRQLPEDSPVALEQGRTRLGLRLKLSHAQRDALVDDASGDRLDAVLCLLQAAWAQQQHAAGHRCYGLPECDPLEGWIVTA